MILLPVKENQGALYRDLQLLSDPPAGFPAAPLTDRRVVQTVESGDGRAVERRESVASTNLDGRLDWPGVRQVFRFDRAWRERGTAKRVMHYGITSLRPEQADPARLLAPRRGHRGIDNRRYRHNDATFGEAPAWSTAVQGRSRWPCGVMRRPACCPAPASHESPRAHACPVDAPRRPSPSSSARSPMAHKP